MSLHPKKTAEKFHISASTLRNYEAKGLIPPSARSTNGYRTYTERHEAYLACIVAVSAAFGTDVTAAALKHIQLREWHAALWIVREQEIGLYEERVRLAALLRELEAYADGSRVLDRDRFFNIHEVSLKTGAPKSAIRYWEKEGMLTVERNSANGYRLYGEAHLLKVRIIQLLQSCIYSEETVALKQSLKTIDPHQIEEFMTYARQLPIYLNKTLMTQMRAISRLYSLIEFEQED